MTIKSDKLFSVCENFAKMALTLNISADERIDAN